MFLSKNDYLLSDGRNTNICKTKRACVRGGWVWCCVPVPLPLPIGADGHVGHDTRLSGWGMVFIPL